MENEWFEQLTEAQKTQLRGMGGSMEELAAFCKEENLDLPDDVLDAVSGGYGCYGVCEFENSCEHSIDYWHGCPMKSCTADCNDAPPAGPACEWIL